MLTRSEKTFTIIFVIIIILELLCGSIEHLNTLHYITKPSIVISLILFFYKESKSINTKIRIATLMALIFSLVGDILLMFVQSNGLYFILGLVAFLMAHVIYVSIFLKHRNVTKRTLPFVLVLSIYAIGLFYFLKDGLGELLIPVLVYMLTILSMATTAYLRTKKVGKLSYIYVLVGAILFLISDTLLAIDKFNSTFTLVNVLIMFTYAFAQYFIVFGVKKVQ